MEHALYYASQMLVSLGWYVTPIYLIAVTDNDKHRLIVEID